MQSAKRELELWFGPLKKNIPISEKAKRIIVNPSVPKDSERY